MTDMKHSIDPAKIRWTFRDPEHLDAHRDDFFRPLEELLEAARPDIAAQWPAEDGAWLCTTITLPFKTGKAGIREVPSDGSKSFWGYRRGRSILSHLIKGDKEETSNLCIWGFRRGEEFVIHTVFAGAEAPREIHDPEIEARELPAAIEYWRRHAIIVGEGDFAHTPYTS